MKLPFKSAASLTAIVVVLVQQITLARTPAETKYLANINRSVNVVKSLSRTHASLPDSSRLQYGYSVCRALDLGAKMNDLRAFASSNKFSANETSYVLAMQVSAIYNLCPEHKPLLGT